MHIQYINIDILYFTGLFCTRSGRDQMILTSPSEERPETLQLSCYSITSYSSYLHQKPSFGMWILFNSSVHVFFSSTSEPPGTMLVFRFDKMESREVY